MQLLKDIFVKVLLILSKLEIKGKVPVLLYHRITQDDLDSRLSFSTKDQFAEQMKYLYENGYRSLKVGEYLDIVSKKVNPKGKCFMLTFDDGFRDNYDAIKLANGYGFFAIVFVSTEFIGKKYEHIPYKGNSTLGYLEKKAIKPAPFEYLDEVQLLELKNIGNELYPHTHTHICLVAESASVQKDEIIKSRDILRNITKKNCNCFSYPYGIYSNESIQILLENGFTCAFSVDPGTNAISRTDVFRIKRHNVDNLPNLDYFRLELTGAYRVYLKLARLVR